MSVKQDIVINYQAVNLILSRQTPRVGQMFVVHGGAVVGLLVHVMKLGRAQEPVRPGYAMAQAVVLTVHLTLIQVAALEIQTVLVAHLQGEVLVNVQMDHA